MHFTDAEWLVLKDQHASDEFDKSTENYKLVTKLFLELSIQVFLPMSKSAIWSCLVSPEKIKDVLKTLDRGASALQNVSLDG